MGFKRIEKGQGVSGRQLAKSNRAASGLTRSGRRQRLKETLGCICPSRFNRDIKCEAPKHM